MAPIKVGTCCSTACEIFVTDEYFIFFSLDSSSGDLKRNFCKAFISSKESCAANSS